MGLSARETTDQLETPLAFSVVVPSNRDPASIQSCLDGLRAQDYPGEQFEVIVVDDGAPVPLAPVVDDVAISLRTRVLRQAAAGPATARNAGARLATGRFLAFTDDDCVPEPDWLRRLADSLVERPDALVGGIVENLLVDNRYAAATQRLIDFVEAAHGPGSPRRFFTTCNLAVSRDAFFAAGGFDESFAVPGGEDREFCERWHAQGRALVAAPLARVGHAHATRLRTFLHQHRNYGGGAYRLRQRRREPAGFGLAPEPLGFYLRLVCSPLGRLPLRAALAESALLFLAQLAALAGYLAERRRTS